MSGTAFTTTIEREYATTLSKDILYKAAKRIADHHSCTGKVSLIEVSSAASELYGGTAIDKSMETINQASINEMLGCKMEAAFCTNSVEAVQEMKFGSRRLSLVGAHFNAFGYKEWRKETPSCIYRKIQFLKKGAPERYLVFCDHARALQKLIN